MTYSIKSSVDYSTGSQQFEIVGENGRPVSRTIYRDRSDAEVALVEFEAAVARRLAVIASYEAVGMRIVRGTLDRSGARYRKMSHVVVVDADDQPVVEYDSIDEVPMHEAEVAEAPEVEVAEPAEAEAVEVRGTITDSQISYIMSLIEDDAHMGLHVDGPDTEAGVRAMSKAEASAYIQAMLDNSKN